MDEIMTTTEFAALVKQRVSTVQTWARTGFGPPAARIGKRIVYRRSDVEAWLESQFEPADPCGPPQNAA